MLPLLLSAAALALGAGWSPSWGPCTHIHCRLEQHTCTHHHLFGAINVNQGGAPYTDGYTPSCALSTSIRVSHHKQERAGRKHHCYATVDARNATTCKCDCGAASEEDPLIVLGDEASGLTATEDSFCPAAGHTGTHHCTGNRIHGSPADSGVSWNTCREACSRLGASCLAHTAATCDCFDAGDKASSLRMTLRQRGVAVAQGNHLLHATDGRATTDMLMEAPGGQPGITTAYCPTDTSKINATMALLWYKMAADMGSAYAKQRVVAVRHTLEFQAHLYAMLTPGAKCAQEDPNAQAVPISRLQRDATLCGCREGYWKVAAGVVTMDRCFPCPGHADAARDSDGRWSCRCAAGYELQQSEAAAGGLACVARADVDGY